MSRLAITLSSLALLGSAFLAYDRFGSCSSCGKTLAPDAGTAVTSDDRLAALERRLAALEARPEPLPPPPARGGASADRDATLAPGARPPGRGAAPPAVEEMERRLAALEEYRAKAEEDSRRLPQRAFSMRNFGGSGSGSVYGSAEDAKADLGLTDPQKGDFDRIVADAKRDIDELRKIPDEEGKTWDQAARDLLATGPDGSMKLDLAKVLSFSSKTIPGRNETYAGAEKRIRTGARSRLRDTLTTDQQAKFDKAVVEPMLGGGVGPGFAMMTFGSPAFSAGDSGKPAGR